MSDRDASAAEHERPFECELCGDRFETREQLKDHEMDGDITTP